MVRRPKTLESESDNLDVEGTCGPYILELKRFAIWTAVHAAMRSAQCSQLFVELTAG